MSKIFEALNRGKNEICDLAIGPLEDEQEDLRAPALVQPAPAEIGRAPQPDSPPAPGQHPVVDPAPSASSLSPASGEFQKPWARKVSLSIAPATPILPFDGSHTHAGEQYRIIRTKICQDLRQPQIIVISSAGSGDGKSTTAINIAAALSLKSNSKVLLVDGDLRRSTLHSQLGLTLAPGLANVLESACKLEHALIQAAQVPNLYVLTAGESRSNATELLDSSRWLPLCASFRKLFTYVVVDSPPVRLLADYDLILAGADGVVMVMRPDHSNRTNCLDAVKAIPQTKLIGAVMNCAEDWLPQWNSVSGYSHYRY